MKRGHIPIRQCVGCRVRRPAKEMIRLREQSAAVVIAGPRETMSGRGCYICPHEDCLAAALKKKAFARALRRTILTMPSKESLLKWIGTEEVTG